jgi:hypothetical protein
MRVDSSVPALVYRTDSVNTAPVATPLANCSVPAVSDAASTSSVVANGERAHLLAG